MQVTGCDEGRHSEAILSILNEVIATSTALYDYQPRPPAAMETWFEAKRKGNHPVIGVELDDGSLGGFASYGTFRAWPAYKYSVEHSVYVRPDNYGQGIGRALIDALVASTEQAGIWTIQSGVFPENTSSLRLFSRCGFRRVGVRARIGQMDGQWRDVALLERRSAVV